MAKQTFTTGQVLTAAQMTSLQQTAMGGGSTTAKTTSYVLTAADAGTVIQMNSASATTITVNTGLFAAGDSVQIQNIGAGVCTLTAGTATVNTYGSLALSQYQGGQLYFNTTSAAFLYGVDASATSGGMTLLSTTTLTTAATTVSSISGAYNQLYIQVLDPYASSVGSYYIQVNTNSTANAYQFGWFTGASNSVYSTATPWYYEQNTQMALQTTNGTSDKNIFAEILLPNYADTTSRKAISAKSVGENLGGNQYLCLSNGHWNNTAAITSFTFGTNGGTWTQGTMKIWGIK